uniref:Trafficking protein particle complex subunit 11 n=1 Tax=Phallusia mammillata TaxID=59560 RepID=A0A6F9DW42_9ASCI|nr:trafficking protein particle complex subunit 11-like [Phallusia mammillata]
MANSITLPNELQCCPKPFVVLTGLDITYNAVHKTIWDAFSNNRRPDRLQVKFACLPGDHAFPRCKTKRSSYDWYIPKGLLKTKWMTKHLNEIPALVVVFFELDWDELAWRERHLACASRVQVVRTSLQGRTTKVAVVLIQKSTPLPPGEDMVAAERAAALCSACDLSSKSLFVLPHSDHLLGYIVRLESAFVELAQTYYHSELRRVKAHKEFLNKTTHQLLFPRHQFKIAFFSEFMQDASTALKHYRQSYTHIHELRSHATNNLEVKVVGGFVNYKICSLCFLKLNAPLDAINQFQRHVEQFKYQFGNPDLMFEHCAWLSQQYLLFADLFSNAIEQGLSAIQTQHPGFYYQQAAHYATLRRQHALSLCVSIESLNYPSPDPLAAESMDFFGQRPWRQGHQRIDPPDVAMENDGILALQKQELQLDHSWIIIPLISSAVTQFKKFHCPRLKRHLTIKMAIEYYHAEDYSKVIVLLCRATPAYRESRWCSILTQLVSIIFQCSYMLADVQNYLTSSFELLSSLSQLPSAKKKLIQENMFLILCGKLPKYVTLPSEIVSQNNKVCDNVVVPPAWEDLTASLENPRTLHVEMTSLVPFVECKARFSQPEFSIDTCICMEVFIRITCPEPIQFIELSVGLNNFDYDSACIISDTPGHGALYYKSQEIRKHVFEFPVDLQDLYKSIQVKNVTLKLGSETGRYILQLNWLKTDNEIDHEESDIINEIHSNQGTVDWESIKERKSTNVVERKSRLDVQVHHSSPALTNEAFPLTFVITSEEDLAENINILITLKPDDHDDSFLQAAHLSVDCDSLVRPSKTLEMELGCLKRKEKLKRTVYIRSSVPGAATVTVQTQYNVSNLSVQSVLVAGKQLKMISCPSKSSFNICFDVVEPFSFTAHLMSMNMESISSVYLGQSFLMLASLTTHSVWPIEVQSSQHNPPVEGVFSAMSYSQNDEVSVLASEGESLVKCLALVVPDSMEKTDTAELGLYTVRWKRYGSKNCTTETSLKLPTLTIRSFPISIDANFPAYGVLRKSIKVTYNITNKSKDFKIIEAGFESVEAFMFSGPKQTKIFLSPFDSHSIKCIFIPLALGYQALPKMQIRGIYQQHKGSTELVQKENIDNFCLHCLIPTHLYIKPMLSG